MTSSDRPKSTNPKSLSGLLPFLRPYRGRIGLALLFLVLAAGAMLAFPVALRSLIDGGLVQADKGAQVMALREHAWRCLPWPWHWACFRPAASAW